jgi:nicotinamide-nucleotide amidase
MTYNKTFIADVKNALLARNETLAVAESVTSGHLQAALSLADGATQFFQGGITAYNLTQKSRLLHVDTIHALQCNCVSEKVSGEMALHVSEAFSSTWAIGITGYAAPIPEQGVRDLFSMYAFVYQRKLIASGMISCDLNDVLEAQIFYTNEVLKELIRHLNNAKNAF